MSLRNFTEDLNIISKLPDNPTLTAAQLKAKFDEGSLKIKEYINETLLSDIENAFEAKKQEISQDLEKINENIPVLTASLEEQDENKALCAKAANLLYNMVLENGDSIEALQSLVASLNTLVNSKQKTIICGEGNPSGGADGDIYLMY